MVDYNLFAEITKLLENVNPERNQLPYFVGLTSDGIEVFLVDGDLVKIKLDKDFCEGNNTEESSWVYKATGGNAKVQVVIDWQVKPREWCFNLYHELFETRLMIQGMSYNKAHEQANLGEMKLREQYFYD